MRSWSVADLDVRSGKPQILFSSDDSRALVMRLAAGERLTEHPFPERAWIMPVSGEIEVASVEASPVRGGPGLVIEVSRKERHEIVAREDALLLFLLTPWPEAELSEAVPPAPARAPGAAVGDDPMSLDPLSPLP
jgi:redox-sensitive bicupin YhaK (pirin superfamily)